MRSLRVLILGGLLLAANASGSDLAPMTLAQQGSVAPVVIEGTVVDVDYFTLEDGHDVRDVIVEPTRLLRSSSMPSSTIRLRLPGGFVNGNWDGGDFRDNPKGQRLLALVRQTGDGYFVLVGGLQSLFTSDGGVAYSGLGDPLFDVGCDSRIVVARPVAEAPQGENVVLLSDRVFVESPREHGMVWSEFLADANACILKHPFNSGEGR